VKCPYGDHEWVPTSGAGGFCGECGNFSYSPETLAKHGLSHDDKRLGHRTRGVNYEPPVQYMDHTGLDLEDESLSDALKSHGIDASGCCTFGTSVILMALSPDGRLQLLAQIVFTTLGLVGLFFQMVPHLRELRRKTVGLRRRIDTALRGI
jgi:hypothetical protein